MAFLEQAWLRRTNALAQSSKKLYFIFTWSLAAFAYASLLIFPVLAVCTLLLLAYFLLTGDPLEWVWADWLLASALLVITGLAIWFSTVLFKTKVEPPHGKPLTEKNFKILLDRIGELALTYNAPEIHNVKLTTRFEIEIQRTPSNGFPSSFTNTLLIGLPVMSCTSPLHLKLLLARQIGHLASTRHSYQHRLIYLRKVWQAYARHYASEWNIKTFLFRLFFSWYAKLFELSTRAAMRIDQMDKDQYMLEITTEDTAAEVVAIFAIKKYFLENEFWPELNNIAFTSAKPTYLPYSSMSNKINAKLDSVNAQIIYENELNRVPDIGDLYAHLRKRLTILGVEEFIAPKEKAETAANHFLGEKLQALEKQLDNVWYLKNKSTWNLRYKKGIQEKEQLKLLRKQAAQALLSNAEARQYLLLLEKYVDKNKALPLYMEILETNALDAEVCYELGRLLLDADEEAGIKALHIAMDSDTHYTVDCCQHIVKYLANHGDMKQAQQYRRMILEHQVEN